MIMKALSIQQPWAWAIIHAGKDIENRSWSTNFRGRVLIHTGKVYDDRAIECIEFCYLNPGEVPRDGLMVGGIIGSVEIVDCVTASTSPWFIGKYGFVLKNPLPLQFMPCLGRLSFFDVEYKSPQETNCNGNGGVVCR